MVAVKPPPPQRSFVSTADNLEAILAHLKRTPRFARRFQRYFTFTHLHNDPGLKADDLRLRHAALAKLVNSLSWKAAVVVPFPIDAARTVWVVDVRKLDWDRQGLWGKVLAVYPYGLKYDRYLDSKKDRKYETIREAAREIEALSGTWLPAVRADWFLATASRPPLYHDLLRSAENRRRAGTAAPRRRPRQLPRATSWPGPASPPAGCHCTIAWSNGTRPLTAPTGKATTSSPATAASNLVRTSRSAPDFKGNPFADKAFDHAGGEIIFNLPNGLQGYMLIDAKDKRIDEGPIDVVRDKTETAGSVVVVNGLSCMACHQHGMIKDFNDAVRTRRRLGGNSAGQGAASCTSRSRR